MQTIITHPAAEGYQQDLDTIESYVAGARVLKAYVGKTGCRLLLGITEAGDYFTYVYGGGYRRFSITGDKADALRLMDVLTHVHGIDHAAVT